MIVTGLHTFTGEQGDRCQGERTKFDSFVDPNVEGAKRRVYSDLRIYCN